VDCCVGNRLRESCHGVLGDLLLLLEGAAYFDGVVGSISKGEEGGRRGVVELLLKLFVGREAVDFNGAWVLLALVKLLAHELGEHLVDAQVREEGVVLLEQQALVLELSEITLQFVEPNHFCDRWDL